MRNIESFIRSWRGRGYEKGESQTFWLNFLRDVLNVQNPENFIIIPQVSYLAED